MQHDGYGVLDRIARPEVGQRQGLRRRLEPPIDRSGVPGSGARPTDQAAKRAGAATFGGRRADGCPTTPPTVLPIRMTCGGCWMATPHREAFAAFTVVNSEVGVGGYSGWADGCGGGRPAHIGTAEVL
jgi:hypothetical protein